MGPALQLSETEQWRRRYRRGRKRRASLIAVLSTVVTVAVVAVGISHAPGWSTARETFLSGNSLAHDTGGIARGLLVNLEILAVAEPSILLVALLVSTMRTSISPALAPLRLASALYVDLFRGCPTIILLFLFGVGIPSLRLHHVTNSALVWGSLAIILNYAAFVAEVFRAGIQSVHPSQRAAARSLGLTQRQTLRLVVLPQAVRNVVPALLNDFVSLQKDVGLISIVGAVTDAIQQATIDNQTTFNFTPYVIAGLLFILIAAPSGRFADWYSLRALRSRQPGVVV